MTGLRPSGSNDTWKRNHHSVQGNQKKSMKQCDIRRFTQALEEVKRLSCGVSSPANVQDLTGHGPEQPPPAAPAQNKGLDWRFSRRAFPSQWFCDTKSWHNLNHSERPHWDVPPLAPVGSSSNVYNELLRYFLSTTLLIPQTTHHLFAFIFLKVLFMGH